MGHIRQSQVLLAELLRQTTGILRVALGSGDLLVRLDRLCRGRTLTCSLLEELADKRNWVSPNIHVVGGNETVQGGLQATCQVLTSTRNRAVLPVLLAGAHSTSAEVRAAVIRAAIRRLDPSTHTQLVRHFAELDAAEQAVLCETHRRMPHHAAAVLRQAILDGDATMCAAACTIVRMSADYEQFATLVKAAENTRHPHTSEVLDTITLLADMLFQELAVWAGGDRKGGHDPSFKRHQALAVLEGSMSRFGQHRRTAILDAFLVLAPVDNATYLKILREPQHAAHNAVVAELIASQDVCIIERLVELLRDTDAPPAALEAISNRSDQQFVRVLLRDLKHPAPLRVLHNMKRMRKVAWLEANRHHLLDVDGRAQALAVDLAAASGISRESQFKLLEFVLENGLAEGRRASCQALAAFDSERANELVVAAVKDPDASVEAVAVRQLRARRVPNSLQLLVARLDSPSSEVRDAASASLAEFNFARYKSMFDLLDENAARTTGSLVHKIDHTACQKLAEELASPSLSARLRAIEMAVAMAATDDVRLDLTGLATNENVSLRKEALLALGHCRNRGVVPVLEAAALDHNSTIAEAARLGLATFQQSNTHR